MLPSLLIVFREVFEAGLVIGIVMAVTSSVPGRGLWVAGGVAVALVFVVDEACDRDVPHPTEVASNKPHKRTAILLTFAG